MTELGLLEKERRKKERKKKETTKRDKIQF